MYIFAHFRNGRTGKSIRQRIKKSFRRSRSRRSNNNEAEADKNNESSNNIQQQQQQQQKKMSTASGLSPLAVEEAATEVKLSRKPTVKFNKGLRKLLAASDTETEDEDQQQQQQQQQQKIVDSENTRWGRRPFAGGNRRKPGVAIKISDEQGREMRGEEEVEGGGDI